MLPAITVLRNLGTKMELRALEETKLSGIKRSVHRAKRYVGDFWSPFAWAATWHVALT